MNITTQSLQTTDIGRIFSAAYNGEKNFMTPNLVGYRQKRNLLIEISSGARMFDPSGTSYGVTVIELRGIQLGSNKKLGFSDMHVDAVGRIIYKKRSDLSQCCHTMAEVEKHITEIKEVARADHKSKT